MTMHTGKATISLTEIKWGGMETRHFRDDIEVLKALLKRQKLERLQMLREEFIPMIEQQRALPDNEADLETSINETDD